MLATDRWLLRRILNNLVVNAIRHSGTTGQSTCSPMQPTAWCACACATAAAASPLDDQPQLFVKQPRARQQPGHRDDTGLGLVFCKMAAEVLGGSIAVDSAPGAGTSFTVSLPAAGVDI